MLDKEGCHSKVLGTEMKGEAVSFGTGQSSGAV